MGTNYYSSGKKIPKVKESLSDKINDEFTFEFTDVKEAVKKLEDFIIHNKTCCNDGKRGFEMVETLPLFKKIKEIFGKKLI